MLTLHVHYLTFMSGGRGDGFGVRGDKKAMPVTAVRDSNIVNATWLDICKEPSGQFCSRVNGNNNQI